MVTSLKNGVAVILERLVNMPALPGVYRMVNDAGMVIYVGKAKNLLKRLTSYTRPERLEYRIQGMVANIASLEVITTVSETEALLLEANLIKKYEPKYNILLKDDKSYPYILLATDVEFPRLLKHRGAKLQKGKYYGPFPSASSVNRAITDLQKAFLLRSCTDSFFNARKRPCIEYQIKRCSAPCVHKISKEEYANLVTQAKKFLEGRSREIQEELVQLMEQASLKMHYEKAASYRDRIKALNQIQAKQIIHIDSINDADVIGIYLESGQCCIQVFFFRAGRNLGNVSFYPKNVNDAGTSEVLASFVMQYYNNNHPPHEVIISAMMDESSQIEEALSSIAGYRVKITLPKAGDKLKLVKEAVNNAQSALRQRILGKAKQEVLLLELAKLFDLPAPPKRIEIYDNSHIMGKHEVGAMVVAGSEGFNKKAYRRFNIKGDAFGKGDDYAMMEQVIFRRFSRLKQEHPQKTENIWPDLLLIDGGLGHMSVVQKVLTELGLEQDIKFACIAKGPDRNAGREQFFMVGRQPFQLPHDSQLLYYLQLLRDEAHRFAIGSHRIKRAKSVSKSALDEIPNIGGKRKKILINHFGSVDAIRSATIEDLTKVEGINRKTAEVIYGYLRGT